VLPFSFETCACREIEERAESRHRENSYQKDSGTGPPNTCMSISRNELTVWSTQYVSDQTGILPPPPSGKTDMPISSQLILFPFHLISSCPGHFMSKLEQTPRQKWGRVQEEDRRLSIPIWCKTSALPKPTVPRRSLHPSWLPFSLHRQRRDEEKRGRKESSKRCKSQSDPSFFYSPAFNHLFLVPNRSNHRRRGGGRSWTQKLV